MRKSIMKLAAAAFFLWAASIYGGVSLRADYCPDDYAWIDGCEEQGCSAWWEPMGGPCYVLHCTCGSGNSGTTGCCF